jgi:hypothetical protein
MCRIQEHAGALPDSTSSICTQPAPTSIDETGVSTVDANQYRRRILVAMHVESEQCEGECRLPDYPEGKNREECFGDTFRMPLTRLPGRKERGEVFRGYLRRFCRAQPSEAVRFPD